VYTGSVESRLGRCWCEYQDSATCERTNNGYERFDFLSKTNVVFETPIDGRFVKLTIMEWTDDTISTRAAVLTGFGSTESRALWRNTANPVEHTCTANAKACTTEATAKRCGEAYASATVTTRVDWHNKAKFSPKSCVQGGRFEVIARGKECVSSDDNLFGDDVNSAHLCRQICRNNKNCMFYTLSPHSSATWRFKCVGSKTCASFASASKDTIAYARQNFRSDDDTEAAISASCPKVNFLPYKIGQISLKFPTGMLNGAPVSIKTVAAGFSPIPYDSCAVESVNLEDNMDTFITDGAFGYFLDRRWCPAVDTPRLTKHYVNDDGSEMEKSEAEAAADEGAQECLAKIARQMREIERVLSLIEKFLGLLAKASVGFIKSIIKVTRRLLKIIVKGLSKVNPKVKKALKKILPKMTTVCDSANKVRPIVYKILDYYSQLHCYMTAGSLANAPGFDEPCSCGALSPIKPYLAKANSLFTTLNAMLDFIPKEIEEVYSLICEGPIGDAWDNIYEVIVENIWNVAIQPIYDMLLKRRCVALIFTEYCFSILSILEGLGKWLEALFGWVLSPINRLVSTVLDTIFKPVEDSIAGLFDGIKLSFDANLGIPSFDFPDLNINIGKLPNFLEFKFREPIITMLTMTPWQKTRTRWQCAFNFIETTTKTAGECQAKCDAKSGCGQWTYTQSNELCRYAKDSKGCCANGYGGATVGPNQLLGVQNAANVEYKRLQAAFDAQIKAGVCCAQAREASRGPCTARPHCCKFWKGCSPEYNAPIHACSACTPVPTFQSVKDGVIAQSCTVISGSDTIFGHK
jgi:hypothetical protein